MSGNGRPAQSTKDSVAFDEKPGCIALEPLARPSPWSHGVRPPIRPNATFVTQLLATAEHAPQTRSLRRGTPAEALTAYGAGQFDVRLAVQRSGIRTRRTI